MNGIVKFFNKSKNYGFITSDEDSKEYFFHGSDVKGDFLNENDKVSFDIEDSDRGKKAANVKKIDSENSE